MTQVQGIVTACSYIINIAKNHLHVDIHNIHENEEWMTDQDLGFRGTN